MSQERCSRRALAPLTVALALICFTSGRALPASSWGAAGDGNANDAAGLHSLAVPAGPLYLVPSDIDEARLGEVTPVHEYAEGHLMVIKDPSALPASVRNRLTSIEDLLQLTYRSWKGRVTGIAASEAASLPDGYYLVSLVGPEDEAWEKQLALFGVKVVDKAWPYGLVVHASGAELLGAASAVATSYGYSVIQGIAPVPLETRLSGELLRVVKGEQKLQDIRGLRMDSKGRAVVRLFYYNDPSEGQRPLDRRDQQLAEIKKHARIPGSDLAYGYDDAILVGGADDLRRILHEVPSVAYVEAIHDRQTDDHAQVYYPVAMAVAPPLYTVKPIVPEKAIVPSVMPEEEIPDWVNGKDRPGPQSGVLPGEAVVQNWVSKEAMPAPIANFEGLGTGLSGFTMTGAPPDTEGDVGPNHYVQWVNSMFAVFDKTTGGVLYGPANGNTLFSSLGGRCASDNDGDPLVMYDRIADRWFMSQFSVSASPYYQCVAVSQTNNPVTSAWNLYAYDYGTNMNDYGKSGVWPDGYYIMYHMFANGSSWAGTEVCAFDRVKMLAGQVASQQCFGPNANYGGLLPTNFQGSTLPPSGSPNYFVAYGTNQLFLWPFHVDWTTPSNSTFPFNTPTTLPVASFTEPCGGSGGTCVPQLGTTTQLDTLGDRLMWRMNYRNFGTYESLVLNHSVTAGAGTGIRWYEIRNPSTTPTIYQQGTFAPADTTWRWMGSVNMDKNGDIAAGYSTSSSTMNPSLWYTGRLVTDPLNTFGQGEATLYSGTGSQTKTTKALTRWGDYSTMSVDPSDDCTFWFTSEYLSSDGAFNWRTRIGSFKFASCTSCTPPGAPTITSITDNDACAQSGIRVYYTAGSGATSHNLLKDGAVVVTGYTSGATYNPGDTASHIYVVQAVNLTCTTNSTGSSFADANGTPATPAAPTVSDVSACAQTGVSISWGAVSGATGYDLQVDGGTVVTGVTSPYTYSPGNGNAHNYAVRAKTATCTGSWSAATAGTDANNTPGAPAITGITDVNACAQSGIQVSYTPGSGAVSHDLLKDGAVVVTGYVSGATYNPGDGASHTYVVRAVNGACTTDSAGSAFADAGSLGTPAITSITDNDACAQSGIKVNYTAGSGATSHNLLVDGSVVVTGYASGATYNPGNTASHTYVVQAVSGSCTANSAGSAFADANNTPGAPVITSITDANACAQSGIQVTYTAGSGATSHNLLRDGSVVVTGYTSGALYNPGDLASHNYVVRAVNGTCFTDSAGSSFADANATPAAPTSASASASAYNSISVTWTTVTGATGYNVYRATGTCPQASYAKITASPVAGPPYADNTVSGSTTYAYVVTALVGACESVQSPCAQATTPAAPCSTPPTFAGLTSVTPVSGATCSLQLAWSAATSNCGGAISYNVYRNAGSAPVPPAGLLQSGLIGTTYTDATVTSGTTYYYIVQALDGANGTSDGNTTAKSGTPGVATAVTLFSDNFESGSGLNGWATGYFSPDTNATDWRGIQTCTAHSGTKIFRYGGVGCTDNYSNTSNCQAIPGGSGGLLVPAGATNVRLSFWHSWQFESGYDGALMRISFDNATYYYLPASAPGVWISGGYNGTVYYPAGGTSTRDAWTGAQSSFSNVVMNLDAAVNYVLGVTTGAAGRTLWIGFGGFSDSNTTRNGWFLDDVAVTYDIPGTCTSCAAPSTLSNNSAADVSACAASGVQVAWSADPGNWGDGGGTRTYDVLRDGTPVQTGIAYGTTSVTTTPPDGLSHTYAVRYNNACGLSATTAGATASDANNPPVPTITGGSSNTCPATSVTLTTESGMTGYQWYLGGSPIAGAASSTYAAALSGNYTVSYTNASGCSGTSAPFPVTVTVCEVSPPADEAHALKVLKNGSNADIQFQDLGTSGYNVYVSTSPNTHPFAVASSSAGKKDCDLATTSITGGMRQVTGYTVESGITSGATVYYILVTADNGAATEGPMGNDSTGTARTADSYCNR